MKSVNGSYEITGSTVVPEHTLLVVNGFLQVHPGTEDVLEKYEKISVNGSVIIYPDDCVILDRTFVMDKYFPLRAKEGSKYYVEKMVIIQDKSVDLAKLAQKPPQGVCVRNVAIVKVAEDVTPELILDRLVIANCAKVSCCAAQESVIAAVSGNVAKIVNAENYVM